MVKLLLGVLYGSNFITKENGGLLAAGIVFLALLFFYRRFEKSQVSTKEIAIIAVLGAVAAIGRVSFAGLPSVQPTTFLVIISGFVFGARTGFMVGSTAALVSNFFLGQGPWTPWQMLAWGLAGVSASLLSKLPSQVSRWLMFIFQGVWGYLFGWLMNMWFWTAFISPLNWQSFVAANVASFPFDTFHAVGNVIFYTVFGTSAIKILQRVKRKLTVSYLN